MDKYDGINRPESVLALSGGVRNSKRESGGYLKGLFIRIVLATVLGLVVFAFSWFEFDFSGKAIETVRNVVELDLVNDGNDGEYLYDKIREYISSGDFLTR